MNLAHKHDIPATEYATKAAHARAHARPQLRLVAPLRPGKASRGVFSLVIGGLLALGLVAMLVINTSMAQGAFEVSALRAEKAQLAEQEATLDQEVSALGTPESLEAKARALGMVPSQSPAFLSLADGSVLGRPKATTVPDGAAIPSVPTLADATASEGIDNGLGDLPAALPADYDPAAADAAAANPGKAKGKAKKGTEDALWVEVPVDTRGTSDGDLSLEPVQ